MLQSVIALLLLLLLGCVRTLAHEESPSICNQLANFDLLQAATALDGTLHVFIRNPTTNTTDYYRLPLDNTTVDNTEGGLKIREPGDFEANVTVETVPWLRSMAKLEKEEENNKQQLMGQIRFAMLNVSKPFVGALVRLQDGRHYCSSSVVEKEEEANPVDCGLSKDDMVVGSMGSADFEETATVPMLIFVKTEKNGKKVIEMRMAKYNNLLLLEVLFLPEIFVVSRENPFHFGFVFAGIVHQWMTMIEKRDDNTEIEHPLVLLLDNPQRKLLKREQNLVSLNAVPADQYFQCAYFPPSSTPPSAILNKERVMVAGLGAFLGAVAFAALFLVIKIWGRSRRGGRGGSRNQRTTESTPSGTELELSRNWAKFVSTFNRRGGSGNKTENSSFSSRQKGGR